jgi:type I restriction enzyme S subunit
MLAKGFPVYGANGIIGFTDKYTHINPILLIGCRGSCGTLHITEPCSYANGNAMALDELNTNLVDLHYLFYYLRRRGFADVISGSSQPQITQGGLAKIDVPLPRLEEQQRIAAILDKADSLRHKRQEAIRFADNLLRAAFYEKCGDPFINSMGWPEKTIAEIGVVTTGNTPSREIDAYFGDAIEWIKSDNINTPSHILTKAREGLSDLGKKVGRIAPEGSTLMTCIAGSASCIGNIALADREVAFNQQINAITPALGIDPEFLYTLLLLSKPRIQATSTNSMKGMVSKGTLEKVRLIWPSDDIQKDVANIFRQTRRLLVRMEASDPSPLLNALQERLLS